MWLVDCFRIFLIFKSNGHRQIIIILYSYILCIYLGQQSTDFQRVMMMMKLVKGWNEGEGEDDNGKLI